MTLSVSGDNRAPVKPLPDIAYVRMTAVLRGGLAVSLGVLGVGIVAFILANPGASSSSVLSTNPIGGYLSLPGLVSGLLSGAIGAFLTLGIAILVATPVVRVISGFYYFRKVGERAMAVVTFSVFCLLLIGVFLIGPLVR